MSIPLIGRAAATYGAAIGLAVAVSLGGCAAPQPIAEGASTEMPNSIQVSAQTLSHLIHFSRGSAVPDARETADLNVFLASAEAERGDSILVEKSAAQADDKRAARGAAALARQGLRPAVSRAADVSPGEVRLVIVHSVVLGPACPNWSKPPGNDFDNTMHSDFGCATAVNFAAMVANPSDLAVGQTMGPQFGDPALAAVQRFRSGKTKSPSNDSASASSGQTLTIAPAPAPEQ
jgi:pilus assembly protein CpaD